VLVTKPNNYLITIIGFLFYKKKQLYMSLNIDPDVNVWLITLAIIKPQRSDKAKTSAKIQLDAVTSK
jgi:hypothetical protein